MSVNDVHEEKETLTVDVNIPGHDQRVTTSLFTHTRQLLINRENGKCWICGATEQSSGHPLEAHHAIVERCLSEMIDWKLFSDDCKAGKLGPNAASFDWSKFDENNPYTFVDDMTVNGVLLCKFHHTGKNSGAHTLPYSLWIAQKWAKEGYKFSDVEIIHHEV